MVKVTRMPMRAAAMLAGVSLVIAAGVAGGVAGGGPAVAAGRAARVPGPRACGTGADLAPRHRPGARRHRSAARRRQRGCPAGGGRKVPKPGNSSVLNGVFCTSAANCWAVGTYTPSAGNGGRNEVLHRNGRKWSQQTTPDPDGTGTGAGNQLFAASCTSATSCWAVGYYGSISGGTGVVLNEALRWNGRKWSLTTTPNPAGTAKLDENQLLGVRCSSASRCWTVGGQDKSGDSEVSQALHWNGTRWSTG